MSSGKSLAQARQDRALSAVGAAREIRAMMQWRTNRRFPWRVAGCSNLTKKKKIKSRCLRTKVGIEGKKRRGKSKTMNLWLAFLVGAKDGEKLCRPGRPCGRVAAGGADRNPLTGLLGQRKGQVADRGLRYRYDTTGGGAAVLRWTRKCGRGVTLLARTGAFQR